MTKRVLGSKYDVFISYNQRSDRTLAASLQYGLRRVGAPWFQPSRLRVFRDETNMEAGPPLRSSLERRLEECGHFVLLASPEAAASRWVNAEVEWWLAHRRERQIFIVVTSGDIRWDAEASDFDWQSTTCLPRALRGHFRDEPLFVDLRWARHRSRLTLKDEQFRNAVSTLAAPIQGLTRDKLDFEDRRAQRRFRWIAGAAALSLAVLSIVAVWAWVIAGENLARAEQNRRESESRRLTAKALEQFRSGTDIEHSIVLAVYAWRLAHTAEAASTLATIQRGSSDLAKILGQHTEDIDGVAFDADSARLATFSSDGSIQFWRVGTWAPTGINLVGPRGATVEVRFDPDGKHLFVWSLRDNSDQLLIWDLSSRQRIQIPTEPRTFGGYSLMSAVVSPDSAEIALSRARRVVVWDIAQTRESARSPEFGSDVDAMHFIDRDQLLLVASARAPEGLARGTIDGPPRLFLWDLRNSRLTRGPEITLKYSYQEIANPKFAPNGSLVVWREGYLPVLFERVGLSLRRVVSLTEDPAPSGYSPVSGFDAKGTRVFVEYRGELVVWDLEHKRRLKTLTPFSGGDQHTRAAISPDGRWIAALNQGKVHVWDLDRDGTEAITIEQKCGINSEECLQTLCSKIALPKDPTQLKDLLGEEALSVESLLLTSSCEVEPR